MNIIFELDISQRPIATIWVTDEFFATDNVFRILIRLTCRQISITTSERELEESEKIIGSNLNPFVNLVYKGGFLNSKGLLFNKQ